MSVADCPRCHGILFGKPKSKPRPTLRVENVMGSTRTIHYRCSNCCYTEKCHYDEDGTLHPVKEKHDKQDTL
jgi:hypothetical protein